jgi:hypothetical protein
MIENHGINGCAGSAVSEGYNNRLSALIQRPKALDVMVDLLYDEAVYWSNVAGDERMWGQKCKSTAAASRRHTQKRVRLGQYLPDSNSSTDTQSDDNDDGAEEETQDFQAPSKTRDASPLVSPEEQPTTDHGKRICSSCTTSKIINKDCTLGVCKRCCVASTGKCKLTAHRRGKTGTSRPYMETLSTREPANRTKDLLVRAIEEKRSVYITYKGGSHGDAPRKVDPKLLRAGKKGQLVETYCHTANATRSFFISEITRIEDENWTVPAATSTYFTSHTCDCADIIADPVVLPAILSVQQFLERIALQQYLDVFTSNGFDKPDTLKYLDLGALRDMGVALGHQGKLLDWAKKTTFDV